jgi:4-hydroxy-tetrahydrodipicolinate synthase
MLAHGADGGMLASAHLETGAFIKLYEQMSSNNYQGARLIWRRLQQFIPLLFGEANPMPIKYCLWRKGLLRSPECRLPLTGISTDFGATLDCVLAKLRDQPILPD